MSLRSEAVSFRCFSWLVPGMKVRVEWAQGEARGEPEAYPDRGTVVRVTPKFVVIRAPAGHAFCVNLGHAACGTRITPLAAPAKKARDPAPEAAPLSGCF